MPVQSRSHFFLEVMLVHTCTHPLKFLSRVVLAMPVHSRPIRKSCQENLVSFQTPSRFMPAMLVLSYSIQKLCRETPRTLPRSFESYAEEFPCMLSQTPFRELC